MDLLEYIDRNKNEHLKELCELLRIPSVSAKSEHRKDVELAASWVAAKLRAIGMGKVEIIPTRLHPLVYAEWLGAPGKPTVLFYGHYDVQPPEPLELWTSPPFEPVVRDGSLWARGSADDKGQVHIHLAALESLMKVEGRLPINVKWILEGEEEVGSANLYKFMREQSAKLKADALLVSDTSMLAPGVPSISYGLRGLSYFQVEITGASQDLHSGMFGGAAPNPLQALADVFGRLHDRHGRIAVPGFYRDVKPLGRRERRALRSLPWNEKRFRRFLGAPGLSGEKGYTALERLWCRPTLELNGMWGGYTGEGAKTVIPAKAWAKFSTRLVPDQDPRKIARQVERQVRRLLPKSVTCKFETLSLGKPWVVPYDHPIFQTAQRALSEGFGRKAVFIREGGSIPFVTEVHDILRVPCVLMGFGQPDENAHAPDEHLALEHYFGGIRSVARFYQEMAELPLPASRKGSRAR
ncbi:MAG TPA: dipeptidase [Candidatus Dormibacteraeota bacterium]|nr:dipeptidase [Candidatus Dormibacteraeota bacterium]